MPGHAKIVSVMTAPVRTTPNCKPRIVTILGLQFGVVLTGAVITETIFAWPGIGRLLIQSINFRDYPLVQGCVLLIAVTYVGVNLLTDLTYSFLDPRIRVDRS